MKKDNFLRAFLVFGILILCAFLSARFHFRSDLTEKKIYTLSPYSKVILASLQTEVNITWYRSKALLQYTPAVRYINDFLEEYHEASDGLIVFNIIDPFDANNTAAISSLGIIPRQIETQEKDGKNIKDIYSGLIIEYEGQNRVVPFFIDTKSLEYDLTRLILELRTAAAGEGSANAIQLIFGRSVLKDEYQYVEPWIQYAGFTVEQLALPVRQLDPGKKLLVIGSSNIDDATIASIDLFLSSGGNAVFFVSGNTVNTAGNWAAVPKKNDQLISLLANYGISVQTPLLLDVLNYRITMPAVDNSKYEYINYPFWITAPTAGMKSGISLLSGVQSLQFYWPSRLVLKDDGGAVQGLVSASASAVAMEAPYDTNPFGKQLSLFSSEQPVQGPVLIASNSRRGRLLVVADEYMMSSLIEYTNSDSNLDFLVNCIEWISSKDELLDLKNKVNALGADSDTDIQNIMSAVQKSRIVNLGIIPLIIVVSAVMISIRRKKRR